tara:strand:+ start:199 stop:567 length:369 start_codon:yes stop_codon:yes gene_type:complete
MSHPHAALPQPVGWRVLVKPVEPKEQTDGGIFLPDMVRAVEAHQMAHGHILAMGDLAFRDRDTGIKWKGTWPVVDERVTYGKYAGQTVDLVIGGVFKGKFLLLNDDEITSILPENCEVLSHV